MQIRIDTEQKQKLANIAKFCNKSSSEVVRLLIENFVSFNDTLTGNNSKKCIDNKK